MQEVGSSSVGVSLSQKDSVISDDAVLLSSRLWSGALGRAVSGCARELGAQVQ